MITYTDISKAVGYNYKNKKTPFYIQKPFFFVIDGGVPQKIGCGFLSDGCTLKLKILQLIFGCQHTCEYLPASLIHDWLMKYPQIVDYDRKKSSQVLRAALIKEGVNPIKAQWMYLGVELAQWFLNFKTKKWR